MCKHCDNWENREYGKVRVKVVPKIVSCNGYPVLVFNYNEYPFDNVDIDVNYCPFCGKRLV